MSEGCVQPCLSWSAFKVMSLMTCPFCFRTVCRRYESTVPPTAGYVLGTDLNCSESLGCHRQGAVSIPLKPRTYLSRCLGKTRRDRRMRLFLLRSTLMPLRCGPWALNAPPTLRLIFAGAPVNTVCFLESISAP